MQIIDVAEFDRAFSGGMSAPMLWDGPHTLALAMFHGIRAAVGSDDQRAATRLAFRIIEAMPGAYANPEGLDRGDIESEWRAMVARMRHEYGL